MHQESKCFVSLVFRYYTPVIEVHQKLKFAIKYCISGENSGAHFAIMIVEKPSNKIVWPKDSLRSLLDSVELQKHHQTLIDFTPPPVSPRNGN